ncbi:MAG: hypothetical protein EA001_02710 [Oscillatoriales cyanobacterium]|nr:MAG: hypothetical protein EA001_02710 [Oscillatoriales cyanobacterium]
MLAKSEAKTTGSKWSIQRQPQPRVNQAASEQGTLTLGDRILQINRATDQQINRPTKRVTSADRKLGISTDHSPPILSKGAEKSTPAPRPARGDRAPITRPKKLAKADEAFAENQSLGEFEPDLSQIN